MTCAQLASFRSSPGVHPRTSLGAGTVCANAAHASNKTKPPRRRDAEEREGSRFILTINGSLLTVLISEGHQQYSEGRNPTLYCLSPLVTRCRQKLSENHINSANRM